MGQVVVHARTSERNKDAYTGKKMSKGREHALFGEARRGTEKVQWCGLVLEHHKREADGESFLQDAMTVVSTAEPRRQVRKRRALKEPATDTVTGEVILFRLKLATLRKKAYPQPTVRVHATI